TSASSRPRKPARLPTRSPAMTTTTTSVRVAARPLHWTTSTSVPTRTDPPHARGSAPLTRGRPSRHFRVGPGLLPPTPRTSSRAGVGACGGDDVWGPLLDLPRGRHHEGVLGRAEVMTSGGGG